MRVISGCRRGHKLLEFEGRDIRPTTDRVKEAVFNLIQFYVPGAKVLDMFAGSGALSFEALSRGAAYAVLTDTDKKAAELIEKNIESLKFRDICEVRNMSCFDFAAAYGGKFDIIFLDPPYNKGFIEPVLECIAQNDLLSENGIIVLESDNTDFKSDTAELTAFKRKRYGRTYITLYKKGDR